MRPIDEPAVVRDTRHWLERAVIGLNLCPFAKAPHVKGRIHFAVSQADAPDALLRDLGAELDALLALDATVRETTLLVAPGCLQDFLDFNDFLAKAERLVRKRGLEGTIQLASFHPRYRFADVDEGDITNYTNRSPYPMLHLLRESSIDQAVQAIAQPEVIYEANMQTMRQLGHAGWARLKVGRSS